MTASDRGQAERLTAEFLLNNHRAVILLKYHGRNNRLSFMLKVTKLQVQGYNEHKDSAASELVVPVIFVAGLFTFLTLISSFVG